MKYFQKVQIAVIIISFISAPAISTEVFAQKGGAGPKPIKLETYSRIGDDLHKETSGIVKSGIYKNVFWILDDSGNDDKIYAINKKGDFAGKFKKYEGQKIRGSQNVDWEDILIDFKGHIIIADIGNNCECRTDLGFYWVKETDPDVTVNDVVKHVRFVYPRKKGVLNLFAKASYDAEAAFYANDSVYLLTKHRSAKITRLFRLSDFREDEVVELEFIAEFDIDGAVTAADITEDGKRLVVLTYTSVWLFQIESGDNYFAGKKWMRRIEARQAEGIAFDGDMVYITDEKGGRIYRLDFDKLVPVE